MKNLNILFLAPFLLFFMTAHFGFSQEKEWFDLLHDENASFQEIQSKAKAYFDKVGTGKGTGWKPYKRWEYFHELRLSPDESPVSRTMLLEEVRNYKVSHEGSRFSSNGDWSEIGPITMPANGTGQPNGMGRLNCITFHPTDTATIWVGAPGGGIWKTTNHGTSWIELNTGLTRLGVSSIVVLPSNPDVIYLGTGDRDGADTPGLGVWRSTDGGANWAAHNNGMGNRTVYEILMDPNDENTLIAATSSNRIYRSTDAGANWNLAGTGVDCKDIAFKPGSSDTIYGSNDDFFRSLDNGQSWTQITSGVVSSQRMSLAVSADEPEYVYLVGGDNNGLTAVMRSTDGGTNFSTQASTPNLFGYDPSGGTGSQAWYDNVAAADPTDGETLYMGGINIWKSTDGGTSWTIKTHWTFSGGVDDVHADQHALEFHPINNVLYSGNDGGIHYTLDEGDDWTEISSGLAIAQLYKLGQGQTAKDLVISGYQDNGTSVYKNSSFTTEIGGDGMECIVDPENDDYLYGALYFGDIRRSTNGGTSFSSIAGSISEDGGWVTPYKLDPNDPNRMFAGFDNVYRNDAVRTGTVWTNISSGAIGTNNVVDIAIAPSNSNIMYVSKTSGSFDFFRVTNALGSPIWTNLSGSLPASGTPKDIEIDPLDEDHIWIALGNNIYESIDGGSNWSDISGTLPNISLNTIVLDTSSSNEALYVGMDLGVYYIDNSLADWIDFSQGLANVEITELEIFYDTNSTCGYAESSLRASTYGRGLWESDLRNPGTLSPIACFEVDNQSPCVGELIKLSDKSAYPDSWAWSVSPASFSYENGTSAVDENPDIRFSSPGTYTISLTASNSNGSDVELKTNHITVASGASTPMTYDLESQAACGTSNNCDATICGLSGDWKNLTNVVEDNIDWRADAGGTPSGGTGPSFDATMGNASGTYLYLEASGGCNSQTAILESPCIDLSGDVTASLEFAYHMFGGDMGSLHVDLFHNGTWIENVMTPVSGNQGDVWNQANVNLDAYTGGTIKLRIRGITGLSGFESDMAIDDIEVTSSSALPLQYYLLETNFIENKGVEVWWKNMDMQPDISFYQLERRDEKGRYKLIYEVDGTFSPGESFLFLDGDYARGSNYYRIHWTDINGMEGYTRTSRVEVLEEQDIKIFPNPSSGVINIKGKISSSMGLVPVEVHDIKGRIVFREEADKTLFEQGTNIDLSNLHPGLYRLSLQGKHYPIVIQ